MIRLLDRLGLVWAGLFSLYVLWWEINQPLLALRFALLLHQADPRVCLLMAPFVLALVVSLGALAMAIRAFRVPQTGAPWIWIAIADGVSPALALLGHWVVVRLLTR